MPRLTPQELTARKRRNMAIATALIVFIVLVFSVTVLKLSHNRDVAAAGTAAIEQPVEPAR